MADDNTNYKLEKTTITLNKLKPNEYRLWQIQAESTLQVHKCLDIVLGNEPNPTPMDDDGRPIGPIGRRIGATIASWKHIMLSHEKRSSNVLKQLTYSRSICTDTALQRFGPVFKMNTVDLSITNTFESTTIL